MTPENIRFHAAGHIAAAKALVDRNYNAAAIMVMGIVSEYVNNPSVDAPPQLKEKVLAMTKAPNAKELIQLEQWFVDPLNTIIENSK